MPSKSTLIVARLLLAVPALAWPALWIASSMLLTSEVHADYEIHDDPQGGDCERAKLGRWDATSKTCILNGHVNAGIRIAGDDITLDGAGFVLRNLAKEFDGVKVRGQNRVRIRKLSIQGFCNGVVLSRGEGHRIENLSIHRSIRRPACCSIALWGIKDSRIERNVMEGNDNVGICLRNRSTDNRVRRNRVIDALREGISLTDASNDNWIQFNHVSIDRVVGHGIYVSGSNHNTISNNWVKGNSTTGAYLIEADHNRLVFNTFDGNGSGGAWLRESAHNRIFCNDFAGHPLGVVLDRGSNGNQVWLNNYFLGDSALDRVGGGFNAFNQPVAPPGGNWWNINQPACRDANNDGFCDRLKPLPGNIDQFPWTRPIPWWFAPWICSDAERPAEEPMLE